MVEKEKILALSLILIGFTYLLTGAGLLYLMITVGGVLEAIGSMPGTTPMPNLTTYIIAGWFFSILTLVTGLVTLIAGAALLIKSE